MKDQKIGKKLERSENWKTIIKYCSVSLMKMLEMLKMVGAGGHQVIKITPITSTS